MDTAMTVESKLIGHKWIADISLKNCCECGWHHSKREVEAANGTTCYVQWQAHVSNLSKQLEPLLQDLTHTRSCPSLTPGNEEDCTCGLKWRIRLRTEMELRNAWEKRAYEAERAIAAPEHSIDPPAAITPKQMPAMNWEQVRLNGGPPCFHIEDNVRFCGRAERWDGHKLPKEFHAFVSLAVWHTASLAKARLEEAKVWASRAAGHILFTPSERIGELMRTLVSAERKE